MALTSDLLFVDLFVQIVDAMNKFLDDFRVEALFLGNISAERSLLFCNFLTNHPKLGKTDASGLPLRPDVQILKLSAGITVLDVSLFEIRCCRHSVSRQSIDMMYILKRSSYRAKTPKKTIL